MNYFFECIKFKFVILVRKKKREPLADSPVRTGWNHGKKHYNPDLVASYGVMIRINEKILEIL